jgi:hypothetical protein
MVVVIAGLGWALRSGQKQFAPLIPFPLEGDPRFGKLRAQKLGGGPTLLLTGVRLETKTGERDLVFRVEGTTGPLSEERQVVYENFNAANYRLVA